MDWTAVGYQLGVLTIANRQSPMTRFVMHGSTVKYVLVLDFLGHISLYAPPSPSPSPPHESPFCGTAKPESLIRLVSPVDPPLQSPSPAPFAFPMA